MQRIGPYEIHAELGRGGMGVVYRAFDARLRREVALKVLTATADAAAHAERLLAEARAAAKLEHPGIVRVFDAAIHDGCPCVAMELVAGASLAALGRRERLPPDRIARIVRDVADAIAHAHERGVVHRDLKPANVLVARDGRVLVADFGLAFDQARARHLTADGTLLGTPAYMAPEQASGEGGRAGSVDVWALGAILYWGLVGRPPFEADDTLGIVKRVLFDEPTAPRAVDARVPAALEAIALRCLRKEAGDRFGSARAVADALDAFLDGAPAPGTGARAARPDARGGRRTVGIAGALIAAVAVAATIAAGTRGGARDGSDRPAPTIAPDRAPPEVALDASFVQPDRAGEITLAGALSEPGREVTAEGRAAALDPDGRRFSLTLPAPTDRAFIDVVARDRAGNASPPARVTIVWWSPAPEQRAYAERTGAPLAFRGAGGARFVLLPPGAYRRGSPETEERRDGDEAPHEVTLSRAIWIAATEVTNADFRRFRPRHHTEGVYGLDGDADAQPVANVSWDDAVAFCAWLGEREGEPGLYRLPTEAEWERAARAGTTTARFWGDGPAGVERFANVADRNVSIRWRGSWNAARDGPRFFASDDGFTVAAPVGSFAPNPFGLYDVIGNVSEWCSDVYAPYPTRPVADPTGPIDLVSARVVRGGSFHCATRMCRAAARDRFVATTRSASVGFRVVATRVPGGAR